MGINYKYDIDTSGGGWYLYELEFPPDYIAPIKSHANGKEGKHAWGIYDDRGRMSDFRFNAWRWSPTFHGFADGYIIDETHDKYMQGLAETCQIGNPTYKVPNDHRWPCFCMDLQLVTGLSILTEFGPFAEIGSGDDAQHFALSNNDYLADIGFRFRLPSMSFCVEYMKRNDIPREHYKDVALRLIEAREAKRKLGIEYGTLGWGHNGVIKYGAREKWSGPLGEMLDKLVAAYEKMKKNGHSELQCEDLFGTIL